MICHCLRYIFVPFRFFAIRHWCSTSPWLADDIGLTTVRLIISKKLPYRRADFSSFIYNFLARCGTHFLLMKRDPADQHETTIWRNQTDTVTWLAVSVSLPTLLGYQRASAFVNATKLASQPLFSSDEEYKISNVLSNTFFIDIAHVSIAIHIVIVLSPSPTPASRTHESLPTRTSTRPSGVVPCRTL